jgi:hypothetical protein
VLRLDRIFSDNPSLFDSSKKDNGDKKEITELTLTKVSNLGYFKIFTDILVSRSTRMSELLEQDSIDNMDKLELKTKIQSIEYCLTELKKLEGKLN